MTKNPKPNVFVPSSCPGDVPLVLLVRVSLKYLDILNRRFSHLLESWGGKSTELSRSCFQVLDEGCYCKSFKTKPLIQAFNFNTCISLKLLELFNKRKIQISKYPCVQFTEILNSLFFKRIFLFLSSTWSFLDDSDKNTVSPCNVCKTNLKQYC